MRTKNALILQIREIINVLCKNIIQNDFESQRKDKRLFRLFFLIKVGQAWQVMYNIIKVKYSREVPHVCNIDVFFVLR